MGIAKMDILQTSTKTAVLTVFRVFWLCFRLFYCDPLGTLFGCFQCRAFGTSVGGRRDCNPGSKHSAGEHWIRMWDVFKPVWIRMHQDPLFLLAKELSGPLRLRIQSRSRTRLRIAASIAFCFALVFKGF